MLPSCCVTHLYQDHLRSCRISCDVMALEIHSADATRFCVGEEENPWSRAITVNVVLVHLVKNLPVF
jgi:hypothetical protein